MNLTVYTIKERKHFVQILNSEKFLGMTGTAIKRILRKSIADDEFNSKKKRSNITDSPTSFCPGCGNKMIIVIREELDQSYLRIVQCKKCQFSRLMEK